MSFVIIEIRFFLLSILFKGLFIQGGFRGRNLLVSFGIKFDIMFNKVSVKFNLPFGISVNIMVLSPRKTGHAPFNSS